MADIDIKAISTPGAKPKVAGNLVLVVKEGQCGDGCGGSPNSKKRSFRQGHDAALRSKLIKAHKAGVQVEISDGKSTDTFTAAALLKKHGWDLPPEGGRVRAAKSTAKSKKSTAKRLQKSTKRKLKAVG